MKSESATDYNRLTRKINLSRPSKRENYNITDFFSNYEEISKIPGPKEEDDDPQKVEKRSVMQWLKELLITMNMTQWIFLIIMSFLTTVLSISIDLAIKYTIEFRFYLCEDIGLSFIPSFAIWIGFTVFFTMIAASVGEFISRDAEGSGIPEMKSILAGVNIYRYLSFQTVIGKIIGLYSGFAAGLSIGKEGPFVHLAGGITNKLAKLKPFREIKNNHSLKKQMLAASVAVGVTSSFGAPIGGTLFSIEVTATYYFVNNLWKTFF